jgi:uncharacterized integral membrane protein (TIGR00698 family)
MANGQDRTPVLQSEDWWACFIGWFIIFLAAIHLVPPVPKMGKWSALADAFPAGAETWVITIGLFLFLLVLSLIAGYFLKFDLRRFIPGFLVLFIITFIAKLVGYQSFMKTWGIDEVIFALVFGLIISNIFKVPQILRSAGQTEFFIKIGLVCMGADIMFSVVVKAGALGVAQAVLVASVVWFMTYYISRAFKVSERFSAIIATANSICGVSATIAAGGAIQGNKKEVSYMVAWVLVCAVVLILIMPPIAVWLDLPSNMAGAWIGGVIDNTGAVVAAGDLVTNQQGMPSEASLKAAAMVKMAQNVLIGLVAFFMALWATIVLDRREHPETEAPSLWEVWHRFPKFVIGFIVASLAVSFIVEPAWGTELADAVGSICKKYRDWFFTLCFVSIGLETNFKELVSVGGGRPAIAYWLSQFANACWTLFVVWLLWSGTFFTPAILPD